MSQRYLLESALALCGGNAAELARKLGRSETSISRWRSGQHNLDFESALRLARLLHLPPRQVVSDCGLDSSLVPLERLPLPSLPEGVQPGDQRWPQPFLRLIQLLPDGWDQEMQRWTPKEAALASNIIRVVFGEHDRGAQEDCGEATAV